MNPNSALTAERESEGNLKTTSGPYRGRRAVLGAAPCRPMQAPAWHKTQVRVIPQGPRDLVMSRSAVRVRSSAPQLRLRNQAFATGGMSPAPKLESAPDSNATAVGDGRKSRRHLGAEAGGARQVPGAPRSRRVESGTSAPCPLDPRGFQAAARADLVARRRVATRFRGGHRPTGASVELQVSRQ